MRGMGHKVPKVAHEHGAALLRDETEEVLCSPFGYVEEAGREATSFFAALPVASIGLVVRREMAVVPNSG
jgi:hypothetical protein